MPLWPACRERYVALAEARERVVTADGRDYVLTYNPARAKSAKAKISADGSLGEERPCFLCQHALPQEQLYEEVETLPLHHKYLVAVNPYPIVDHHFTIIAKEHTRQTLVGRVWDMAFFADLFPDYLIFFNGACSGASAPDHMHFQAVPKQAVPMLHWSEDQKRQLGVTSQFLYPVIVAVSIVTTFITPYMIRAAQAMNLPTLALRIPTLRRDGTALSAWQRLLAAIGVQTAVYAVLGIAVIVISLSTVLMFTRATFGHWTGNAVCGVLTLAAVSPFLRAIVMRKNHSEEVQVVAQLGRNNKRLLRLLLAARFLLATSFIFYILEYLSPFRFYWHWLVAAVLMLLISQSLLVKKVSRRLEGIFRRNLSAREEAPASSEAELQAFARLLTDEDYEHEAPIKLQHIKVRPDFPFCGKALRESRLREDYGCQVVGLEQADGSFIVPEADYILQPDNVLWLVGEKDNLVKLIIE